VFFLFGFGGAGEVCGGCERLSFGKGGSLVG